MPVLLLRDACPFAFLLCPFALQRVLEIQPTENADAIELVRINGWQCVTKKGEFRAGDLGLFLEIDAIPPDTEISNRFLLRE